MRGVPSPPGPKAAAACVCTTISARPRSATATAAKAATRVARMANSSVISPLTMRKKMRKPEALK